jgi:hypothetical protein
MIEPCPASGAWMIVLGGDATSAAGLAIILIGFAAQRKAGKAGFVCHF